MCPDVQNDETGAGLPETGSWALLLAKWTEFIGASLALPDGPEADRWRAAMPAIVGLQAIAKAMTETHALPVAERAVAFDRASLLIRRHAAELHELWRGEALPVTLFEIIGDARTALAHAQEAGLEWVVEADRVAVGDPTAVIETLIEAGFRGDLWLASPGCVLVAGDLGAYVRLAWADEPDEDAAADDGAATAIGRALIEVLGSEGRVRRTTRRRQVYRQADPVTGGLTQDLIAPTDATLPAGRPLLEPWIETGELVGRFDAERAEAWRSAQARALDALAGPMPVVESD
ncbi:MAG: hypothetical protein AAF138_01810 [Planctomycetota bacterium]